jgi:hypothetical protein
MRITITDLQFNDIISELKNRQDLVDILLDAKAVYELSITDKKKNATKAAHKANKEKTKEKIQNAVNLLRIENRKINVNSVSKAAGVHYKTARKYKDFIEGQN